MVKNAFAILSMLILTCGVAWGQSAAPAAKPILSGRLAKLDIKDAQTAARRGTPKRNLNIARHFGIDTGRFDTLGYTAAAHQFYYLFHDALIRPMTQGEYT